MSDQTPTLRRWCFAHDATNYSGADRCFHWMRSDPCDVDDMLPVRVSADDTLWGIVGVPSKDWIDDELRWFDLLRDRGRIEQVYPKKGLK